MTQEVKAVEYIDWAQILGCAGSAFSDYVKKILHCGIHGILWDDITQSMHPRNNVIETRKNIVLDNLKNQVQALIIQYILSTKRLLNERCILNSEIIMAQLECEKKTESVKKKALKLAKIKATQNSLEVKKKLLDLKYQELKCQMKDCKEMRKVCQYLLPSRQSGVCDAIMNESLSLVGAISSRTDKKNALKHIHDNLEPIDISELWDWILKKRIKDCEESYRLDMQEQADFKFKKSNQRLGVGISKAYGQHINTKIGIRIFKEKMQENRDQGMYYIEKILNGENKEELSDWLVLAVETLQLEAKQNLLLAETDELKKFCEDEYIVAEQLRQVESNMHDLNDQMEQMVLQLQNSFARYKPTVQFLLTQKEKFLQSLNTILMLHVKNLIDRDWTTIKLNTELETFEEILHTNALFKVMLTGNIGAYRYATNCISQAAISHSEMSSLTPIFRASIYHIIEYLQSLIINSSLKERREDSKSTNQFDFKIQSSFPSFTRQNDIIQALEEAKITSKKCCQEFKELNLVYDSWCLQNVQEAMSIYNRTEYGFTFNEWVQNFTSLLYMIQRNK